MKIFIVNKLFILVLFVDICWGARAWFTWVFDHPDYRFTGYTFLVFASFISFLHLKINNFKFDISEKTVILLLVLFIAFQSLSFNVFGVLSTIIRIIPLWVLISERKIAIEILSKLSNWLVYLLVPGIFLYFIMLYIGMVPGIPMDLGHESSGYYFFNYIFLIRNIFNDEQIFRFSSVFLEPGHLATLLCFLLYASNFNFKKKTNLVFLFSVLLSFSLAGYVLLFFGFVLSRWANGYRINSFIGYGLLFVIIYIGTQVYNDGKNAINEYIFDRLKPDDEKIVSGYNRNGRGTDYYFEESIMNGSIILGLGAAEITRINGGEGWQEKMDHATQITGAGVKVFLLYNGVLTMLLYLFAYWAIVSYKRGNRKYGIGYLILVSATFIQAAYPQSYSWIIPFMLGNFSYTNGKMSRILLKKLVKK